MWTQDLAKNDRRATSSGGLNNLGRAGGKKKTLWPRKGKLTRDAAHKEGKGMYQRGTQLF